MTRRLVVVILALSCAACSGDTTKETLTANLGCTTSNVIESLEPGPGVTFIPNTDTTGAHALPTWRAAVGQPVVDRAGRSCEAAPLDSLVVVSWNTHIGHADIRRFVSDLRSGRIVAGKRVRHFVLLLQEVYREDKQVPVRVSANVCPKRMGGESIDVEDLADSLGLALYYVPSMRNGCERGARQDRGNAIMSTLPLSNLRAVELPIVRQRRVAVLADVKGHSSNGNEWTLSVASVHFENRGPGNPQDWVAGRARQARALVSALPDSKLTVVGGDFNTLTGPTEPAVRIVGSRFRSTPEHPSGITYVSYGIVRSHLDYLFFQCAGARCARYWRASSRYGSDHYPIIGILRVTDPAAS